MGPGIIIPLVVLPLVVAGAILWYRRSMAGLAISDAPPVSGQRLTAEALHRLASPPWRVVYEIAGALGDVDHVIIGPAGVIAITTLVADRPDPEQLRNSRNEAVLIGEAAIARGPLDELLRPIGASCRVSAQLYWGRPDPGRAAFDDVVHASALVEGQRLDEWIRAMGASVPVPLLPTQVDAAWRQVVMGIGRPDPLA